MNALRSTVVDVDLDAIASNLRALTPSGAKAIGVVKADAYGHGAEIVSRALVDAGVAMLAVFTVEEGVVLRRNGMEVPVLVLGGLSDRGEAGAAIENGLTVAVWDEGAARALSEAAAGARSTARVQVKVDTGLTRLGVPWPDAVARYAAIRALPRVAIDGVFTHYANADLAGDTFTAEQMRRFADVVNALPERPALVHASNSAGIADGAIPEMCNAVRPGVSLYGLHAAPHLEKLPLRPALRWHSHIQRIASAAAGTGVGYGHEYHLPRDGRIATVPVGYGDGLQRVARRASVLVRGKRVPLAGRVAMDLITLDVTDVPGASEGDEVVIIGEQDGARLTAEDLAAACGTNNYEIVTGIRRLVPRRYTRSGRVVALRTLSAGPVWL